MTCFATPLATPGLDLRIEVEEGVETHAELGFDLLAAAFEDVHGDVCLIAVFEGDGCVTDLGHFVGGEQSHSVDQG